MKDLVALTANEARALHGVVFDLDGTVLSGGALTLEAYRAIHELREAGLRLVACTGRPAEWAAVLARQWPLDLAIAENGAVAYRRYGDRLERLDGVEPATRDRRRARLASIASALSEEFSDVPLADDNRARLTDVTFDVRETATTPAPRVAALRRAAESQGARTFESSIHVHVTLETDDKASGTVRFLSRVFGVDTTAALMRYAFVGDSANDEACFSAFATTFAVANVRGWLRALGRTPRYVSTQPEGAGFAEIVTALLAARRGRL